MINLKEIESNFKGDYIHALYYFIKDDLINRAYSSIDDFIYEDFYLDVDSVFSLDELKDYCSSFSRSSSDLELVTFILEFFKNLSLRLDNNNCTLNGGV